LLADPLLNIDGFLCPGHVSTMIGSDAYKMITQADRAAAITGFETGGHYGRHLDDLSQIESGKKEVAIQYSRGVRPEGNIRAMNFLRSMFNTATVEWRGLGPIPYSGLVFQ